MVEESVFRGMIDFLAKVGVYDIILPFLLVFTIVFAILEKTKIFGMEKVGEKETTKKNLNSMVAFVMAFLVIASTKLVSVINEVMANVVLLILLGVSFMLLVGVFFGDKEFVSIKELPGWTKAFIGVMAVGVVVIFLNALGWLQYVFDLFDNWQADWAASIIFMIIIIGFIAFITKDPKKHEKKEE
jgi:magnesium-transporting ATPase (P-type)